MNNIFSYQMHDQTERPGQLFPQDTHNIIKHRYDLAAKLADGKKVLEVGAGHGIAARLLGKTARQFVAGEYSDENIALLGKQVPSVSVVQFDAHHLPFVSQSFDLVIALAMIYYLKMDDFLHQVKAILKPGGKLFFCMSNKDVPGFVPSPYTTRYYSIPELQALLLMKGFSSDFYGVFAAGGGNVMVRKIKATIKTLGKAMIHCLPNGKKTWYDMRTKRMGERFPLPQYVEEINANSENEPLVALPGNSINRDFRVIYGIATLI